MFVEKFIARKRHLCVTVIVIDDVSIGNGKKTISKLSHDHSILASERVRDILLLVMSNVCGWDRKNKTNLNGRKSRLIGNGIFSSLNTLEIHRYMRKEKDIFELSKWSTSYAYCTAMFGLENHRIPLL